MILFRNNVNNKKLINILFAFSFILLFIILFNKCKYGYADMDETFFIQTAHRIAQGDALIAEEWNASLGFSYLMYPIMRIYMLIFKSFDGVVLNFRYIYLLIWSTAIIYLYFELRKYTYLGAYFSSLFLFIYAPYNIMALSYNSMGILFLVLSCTICLTRNSKISNIVAGSFYSFSVLCHPSLAIMVIYYLIYFLFIKKDKKQLLYFFIGIVIQFIIFCIFVFSRTSLSKILLSIPHILSIPDHGISSTYSLQTTWINTWRTYSDSSILFVIILTSVISYFSKNKIEHFMVVLVLIALLIINVYQNNYYINFMMYPLAFGAPFLFQFNNKKIRDLLFSFFIPGLIYSFCINVVSNQGPYVVFSVLSISSIGCICGFFIYFEELSTINNKTVSLAKVIICIVMTLQLFLEIEVRWNTIYWDTDMNKQTIIVDNGPEKGIYISSNKYKEYENIINICNAFEYKGESILYLSQKPLYYLENKDSRCSAYSSWLIPHDFRQIEYYEINPEKLPDVIIYPSHEYGNYDEICNSLIEKYKYKELASSEYGYIYIR